MARSSPQSKIIARAPPASGALAFDVARHRRVYRCIAGEIAQLRPDVRVRPSSWSKIA